MRRLRRRRGGGKAPSRSRRNRDADRRSVRPCVGRAPRRRPACAPACARGRICYVAAVKIACIGGGPAGLYLGILVKRRAPEHEVVDLRAQPPGGHVRVRRRVLATPRSATSPRRIPRATPRSPAGSRAGTTSRSTSAARSCARPATGSAASSARRCSRSCRPGPRALGVRVEFEHEVRSLAELSRRPRAGRDRRVRRRRELGARRARRASSRRRSTSGRTSSCGSAARCRTGAFTFVFKHDAARPVPRPRVPLPRARLDVHRRVPRGRPGAPPGSRPPTRTPPSRSSRRSSPTSSPATG